MIISIFEKVLAGVGMRLIRARNGQEAVDICSTDGSIDLVLVDIKTPIMNVHTVALIIREFRPQMRIIAQSANALEQEVLRYGDVFGAYFDKPLKKNSFSLR